MKRSAWLSALYIIMTMAVTNTAVFADNNKSGAAQLLADSKWESQDSGEGWSTGDAKGDLYIDIEKVDGNKVYGRVYISGSASYHNEWHKFTGLFSETDATLSFQISSFLVIHLKVGQGKMEGIGIATRSATLKLKRVVRN